MSQVAKVVSALSMSMIRAIVGRIAFKSAKAFAVSIGITPFAAKAIGAIIIDLASGALQLNPVVLPTIEGTQEHRIGTLGTVIVAHLSTVFGKPEVILTSTLGLLKEKQPTIVLTKASIPTLGFFESIEPRALGIEAIRIILRGSAFDHDAHVCFEGAVIFRAVA
jgi:hypothetical protein